MRRLFLIAFALLAGCLQFPFEDPDGSAAMPSAASPALPTPREGEARHADASTRDAPRDTQPARDAGEDAQALPLDADTDANPGPDAGPGSGLPGDDPACRLTSDEFDDELSEAWSQTGQRNVELEVDAGTLQLAPPAGGGWFGLRQGHLLYQTACDDFLLETEVTANASLGSEPPSLPYSVAGLMIRAPESDAENWEMVAVGRRETSVGVELKSTTEGRTPQPEEPGDTSFQTARLRLCRVGKILQLSVHTESGWRRLRRISRDDLSGRAQVGLATSAWGSRGGHPHTEADLRARFTYARFASSPPTDLEACHRPELD